VTRRLVLGALALTVLVLLVLEIPLALKDASNRRNDAFAKVEDDAFTLGAAAEEVLHGGGPDAPLLKIISRYGDSDEEQAAVLDARGRLVAGRVTSSAHGALRTALAGRIARKVDHGSLVVAVPVRSGGTLLGASEVSTPTEELDAAISSFRTRLLVLDGIVLALAVMLAVVLSRSTTRPLLELEKAATRAGSGDLTVRAPAGAGPPEVRSLAGSFNEMVGKLEELVRTQESFVADASHQLRTPLTALRLRLENGDVDGAIAESERLAGIVDALLALARAEAKPAGPLDLGAVVSERSAAWQAVADDRGVVLDAHAEGIAFAEPGRLAQVLDNLIANALAVAPPGTTVEVDGGGTELHVRDEGPGMTPQELSQAFDRFWSRGGGSGLGLAIVRRLLELDGGSIELSNREGGGLDAAVRLSAVPSGDGGSPARSARRRA
jgi:signal transduction histidine kinase